MNVELIQRNLNSPSIRNVRKALRALPDYVDEIRDVDSIVTKILEKVKESDEKTKLIAISTLRFMVRKNPILAKNIVNSIKDLLNDENPNVKGSALEFIKFLVSGELVDASEFNLGEIIENVLDSDNSFLVSTGLDLLKSALEKELVDATNFTDKIVNIYETYEKADVLSKVKVLLESLFDKLSDEQKSKLVERTIQLLKVPSAHVKSISLDIFKILVEKETISVSNAIIFTKKKLRDPTPIVKIKALETTKVLIKKHIKEANELLGVIVDEILLGNTNKKIKLEALKVIHDIIDNIPRDLVYRYRIHKALDIIEKNAVPKSPILKEIKFLSRDILENSLGLTLEKRRYLKK